MSTPILIFDCDGVLLDSNSLKIDAFESVALQYSRDVADKFIEYVRENFGKSRYHFFDYLLRNLVNRYSEELYHKHLDDYAIACFDGYLKCSMVEGVESLIRSRKYKCYVASGSDEHELQRVFQERSLSSFFESVYGSPRAKKKIIEEIVKMNNETTFVMFGDSYNDLDACKGLENITFVYVSKYSLQKKRFESINCLKVNNFVGIEKVLEKIL